MIWSRQAYYCQGHCIPDSDVGYWPYLYNTSDNMVVLTERLKDSEVTNILVNNLLFNSLSPTDTQVNSSEFYIESEVHKVSYLLLINDFEIFLPSLV